MSEEIFEDDFNYNDNNEHQRPPFLTVLIILTWIAVAMTTLSSVISITSSGSSADQLEESMAVFEQMPNDNPVLKEYMKDYKEYTVFVLDNIVSINLFTLIFYLVEGFAALLMFNLKKVGFWLYIGCQVAFFLIVFIYYPSENAMTTLTMITNLIFSTIFSILYGVNLKHLRN
jgi:hypothetical protein